MSNIDEIVAANVLMRLADLKMSQKDLAQRAGLTIAYVNKLLNLKKPISKSKSLDELSKVLGVSEVDLYQNPRATIDSTAAEVSATHALERLRTLNSTIQDVLSETLSETLSPAELELVDLFRAGDPVQRKALVDQARSLLRNKSKRAPPRRNGA